MQIVVTLGLCVLLAACSKRSAEHEDFCEIVLTECDRLRWMIDDMHTLHQAELGLGKNWSQRSAWLGR